jgi:CDP-diacylglycerol--serine O-phosphatidyltransferase
MLTDRETPVPPRRTRRQKAFAVLPTLLTLGNAVCGFGAITITARVGPENFSGTELYAAAQLIFLAMLFDMLDGSAARLTNQTSDFGAQLDSLCDAVSFGVAPAFLMLKLTHPGHLLMNSISDLPFDYPIRLLWAIAVLFMLCAILRLARFNVESDEEDSHEFFSGLPSPAAAGVIAAFPIGVDGLKDLTAGNDSGGWADPVARYVLPSMSALLPVITLCVAILMVSRVRYPHVFNQLTRGHRSRIQLLQIVFALVMVFVVKELAVPLVFCYFAFSAPCRSLWLRYFRPMLSFRSKNGEQLQ